jgi:CHASE3 domain sensor protein
MSTPEEREAAQRKIAALEAEIAEYEGLTLEQRLIPTTAALITAKQNTLTELLKAQAAAAGNAPLVTHFVLCAPLLLFLNQHILSLFLYF